MPAMAGRGRGMRMTSGALIHVGLIVCLRMMISGLVTRMMTGIGIRRLLLRRGVVVARRQALRPTELAASVERLIDSRWEIDADRTTSVLQSSDCHLTAYPG